MITDRTVRVRIQVLTNQASSAYKQLATQTGAMASQTASFAEKNQAAFKATGKAALAFGVVTAYGLKQAVDASISFESAFAGVRKTVKASEPEFAQMQADIRQLAKDIPVTVEELSGIGEAAGQLGIATPYLMSFTRVMADLGVATNMQSTEAATSLARLANITQMNQENFDRLGSTVVDLGNNLATTEAEIVEMGLRLAGAGNQVGMTEAQILGLGGALSSVGIRAEAGGSAISKVMIEIASEVENGGGKLETFAEVAGMTADEFSTAYREDATEAIIRFVEGLGSMEESGKSTLGVLEELEITEVRMRDALLRTSGAGDVLREAVDRASGAWEENIALTVEAEQRYGTTESRLKMAGNRFNDFKISLGDQLAPTMLAAADTAANLADRFSELDPALQGVIAKGALGASALSILGGAALMTLPRVVALNTALAAQGGLLGASRTAMASSARFMLGPWGVALGAAAAGLMVFNRHQQDARSFAEALHDELAETPGDLSQVSDELLVATLRSKDVMGAWRETGLELGVLRRALQGSAPDIALIEENFDNLVDPLDALKTALPRVRDEKRDLAHVIRDLRDGTADYNREAAWTNSLHETSGAGIFYSELEHGVEITDELKAAAAAAGMDVDALTEAMGTAGEEADELTDRQERLQDALLAWRDVGAVHGDVMTGMEDAERARAQAAADAANEVIDAQIRELDSTSETYDEERAVLEDSKTSWEDHASAVRVSLADTAAALEEQNEAYANWKTNLVTVASRAGIDVALALAEMGEEGVALTAAMATGTDAEVDRMAKAIRDHSQRGAEDVVRNLEAGFLLAEAAAATGGTASANALARELGLGVAEVLRIAKAYGIALAEGINPVIVGIGGEEIAISTIQAVSLGNILGTGPMNVPATTDILNRNEGGPIPGSGPDRDSVLTATTPGEHVWTRSEVAAAGGHSAVEELRRIVREGRHGDPASWGTGEIANDGAAIPGARLPKPPDFPYNGIAGSAGAVMEELHAAAQAWVDAQTSLAVPGGPGIGGGIGVAAMMAILREVFPGLALISGLRPGAVTATGKASWHAKNRAVDIPPDMEVFEFLRANYGSRSLELIFSPANARQIYRGKSHYFSEPTRGNHWDHIHWAMANGGIIDEEVLGVGLSSGDTYSFGEAGPERVVPLSAAAGASPRGAMPAAPSFPGSSVRLDPDEYRRRVEVNNRLFELGMLTLSEHLHNLERRMQRTVPFSDEWMRLFEERKRTVDDLLDEHLRDVEEAQRAQDDALGNLNALLDERNRVTERIAEEEDRARDERNRVLDRYNDERLRIEQRFNDEFAAIVGRRAESLAGALPIEERAASTWANSIAAILRNEAERALQREDWAEGLDVLRGLGLSEDAISAFGLEDLTEESLARVRLWSTATEEEIAALNAAIAERQRFAAETARNEAELGIGAVGEEVSGITARMVEELDEITDEMTVALDRIDEELTVRLDELNAEMAAIGLDTGRSWADAIAEGIESGLPGILAAVESANAARMMLLHAGMGLDDAREIAAGNPPAGGSASTAPLGHHYVLPDGRHALRLSDGTWYWASGPNQEQELERLYGPATEHPAIREDRIAGSLVSLFGAGGLERFADAHVQPRYFDGGGWLPPNSLTLAANSTSRWEPVGAGTHMPAAGQDRVVAAIDRQTQVIREGIERGQVVEIPRGTLDGIADHTQARLADQGDTARLRQRRGRAGVR